MAKVLIATIYSADPVLLAATRHGTDRLILLIDNKPDKEQEKSLKLIKESLGRVIDIKTVKTEIYDIVKIATKCVEIIDLCPKEDSISINITSGRKTKAIGLLFAAYARCDRIDKIAYNPEEDRSKVVYLPKLSFRFTESQKRILEYLKAGEYENLSDLADKVELSRAMLYRNIKELEDLGFIESKDGCFELTDAGKIGVL